MNIQLITMWYNEEFLAPFFLNHYKWVDKIHILLDADTDDNTESIASTYPNVFIESFKFPDMMDDILKVRKINEKYRSITDADYVVVVDSDEFIFCNMLANSVKDHVCEKNKSLYFTTFWQIYQHERDLELDSAKPVYLQRCNGDPAIVNCYIKPTIAKAGLDIVWGYGNHSVVFDGKHMSWNTPNADVMIEYDVTVRGSDMLQGAHWKLFDLNETVKRRIHHRTGRQSRFNIMSGLTQHHHKTCVEDIVSEYNKMKLCPVVIKDRECNLDIAAGFNSIFEYILAEHSYAECYAENSFSGYDEVRRHYAECDLPDWYIEVQPQLVGHSVAEDLFQMACEFHRSGRIDQAIKILHKALMISPDSLHCLVYLQMWEKELNH